MEMAVLLVSNVIIQAGLIIMSKDTGNLSMVNQLITLANIVKKFVPLKMLWMFIVTDFISNKNVFS